MTDSTEHNYTYSSGEYYHDVGLTKAVLDAYNDRVHYSHLELRNDISTTVHDFTSDKAYHYIQQTAELVDVFDRLNNELTSQNARRAIQILAQDTTPLGDTNYTHGDYLLAIADDVPFINNFASQSIDNWARSLRQSPDFLDHEITRALSAGQTHSTPPEVWLKANMPYDKNELADLAEDINLETVLIKSCQILGTLRDPELLAGMTDTDQLRTVVMAESVYIPLCEVLGFDALSAALYDTTSQLRLINAGRSDLVEQANQIRDRAGDLESLEEKLPKMIEAVCGEFVSDPVIRNGATDYSSLFRDGIVVPSGTYDHLRIVLRLKSVGSIARKLLHYEDTHGSKEALMPADVLGATIITDYAKQIGPILAGLQQKIEASPNAAPIAAPGRQETLHIKGPKSYIKKVLRSAGSSIADRQIDIKRSSGDFKVAKTSFAWTEGGAYIPVEVQILDAEARAASRYGNGAHINHKNTRYAQADPDGIQNEPADTEEQSPIQRIHRRKDNLDKDKPGINRRSLERSRKQQRHAEYGAAANRALSWT